MEQSSVKQSTFERCKRSQCTFRLLQRNSTFWGNSILWALMSTTQYTAILDLKVSEQGGGGGVAHYCAYIWHGMRILLTVRNALIQQTLFLFSKCAVPHCTSAQLKETPGIIQVKTEVELGMLDVGCGT